MKSSYVTIMLGCTMLGVSSMAYPSDLLSVYQEAKTNDPVFLKARSEWQATKENIAIARSAFLPQLNLQGSASRVYTKTRPDIGQNGTNTVMGYTVSLSENLFNLSAWAALSKARSGVKAATAQYNAAEQSLMLRAASAYFAVLQAYDALQYQLAKQHAVHEQLKRAQQQYRVGVIAMTSVYNAKAIFDEASAMAIANQNALDNALENLRVITGVRDQVLQGLSHHLPLLSPDPQRIDDWVRVAERQNYALQAANFRLQAAKQAIHQQSSAWLPSLSLAGSYAQAHHSTLPGLAAGNNTNASVGLSLNMPLFQGAAVPARTRQAHYQYLSTSHDRQLTHRMVVSQTRQAYLGVVSGAAAIRADQQALKSAFNALKATKAGYDVGTRTMVDVLDDITQLTAAKRRYSDDQYRYLLNILNLKAQAGTLSPNDLRQISSWLHKRIVLQASIADSDLGVSHPSGKSVTRHVVVEKAVTYRVKSSHRVSRSRIQQSKRSQHSVAQLPAPESVVPGWPGNKQR